MKESSNSSQFRYFDFGPFRLDARERLLFRDGEAIPLTPKAAELLALLVSHDGDLLSKETLLQTIWPDTHVDESNLTQHVFMIRKALGGNGRSAYIETIPKRGVRFTAPVARSNGERPRSRRPGDAIAVVVLVAIATVAVMAMRLRPADAPVRTVAVLPFLGDDSYAVGMTDAVISRLGATGRLTVRPTAAVLPFARTRDPLGAGRRLRVDAIVTGNIQRQGSAMRIAAQLVRVSDGTLLWSRTYDSADANLLALEDSLVAGLSGVVVPSRNIDRTAYEAYLKGRHHWNRRTPDGFAKAIEQFRLAVEREPQFALAWAGLADAYNFTDRVADAKDAARRALAIDPSLAEAHAALGNASLFHDFDWRAAEHDFRRAVEINPSYATAHHWYAFHLASQRRLGEALAAIRRAQEIDPLSLIISTDVGQILEYAGRDEEALAQYRRTLELDPNFAQARLCYGALLFRLGDHEQGVAEVRKTAFQDIATAMAAREPSVDAALHLVDAKIESEYAMAVLYAQHGRIAEAVARLERCATNRDANLAMMAVDPRLASLRREPKFQALARRIGL